MGAREKTAKPMPQWLTSRYIDGWNVDNQTKDTPPTAAEQRNEEDSKSLPGIVEVFVIIIIVIRRFTIAKFPQTQAASVAGVLRRSARNAPLYCGIASHCSKRTVLRNIAVS